MCLSFALQPLCFPLHLALSHHCHEVSQVTAEAPVGHTHSHGDHHHHHEQVQHSENHTENREHSDHPDEDHAKFLPGLATTPGPVPLVTLELPPVAIRLFEPPVSCQKVTPRDRPPQRLPAKRIASPRAPPNFA